ncbi:NAD(P)H-dependent oxidoreductase [Burkholderiaceae bacterium DAT-1]|nr:NAD(P)H-dependent oxidoreductase [Burkholderiaceae bacterium DAT-1]
MRVLAVSGSLRAVSINSAFCRAAARLAPSSAAVTVFDGMAALPLFNPDLESAVPPTVQAWRQAVAASDVLLIASPEYAHGLSGVMKNALDWLVSFEPAAYKPVVLVNTAPRASHAWLAMCEVLRTMSLQLIEPASLTFPLIGECTHEHAMIENPTVCALLARMYIAMRAGWLGVEAHG